MKYLLDTNIVSELGKAAPDAKCVAWLQAHKGQCGLSSITVAEIRYGIERLVDSKRKSAMEADYEFLCSDYSGHFLVFDESAAAEWGRYAAELESFYGADWWKRFDLRDTQIAAIARENGLTVATRNEKDFPFCQIVNPFV